jgi:hypothetical protein
MNTIGAVDIFDDPIARANVMAALIVFSKV